MADDKPRSGGDLTSRCHPIFLCCVLVFLMAGSLSAQQGTHVSARFAAIKGVVMVSTVGLGEKQVHKGDSVRSGTVITCGADSGASLKPMPTLHVIVYPDTKVRFDGADVQSDGGGSVMCTILAGKALFHMDQPPQGPEGTPKETQPAIKVTVVTDEGVIVNKMGGPPEATDTTQPGNKATQQITAATWTVQHDEGRTVVAVGEGLSHVSIGKGAAAGGGEVGGQVKVPQGSVIWLFNRGGKIEADLVDTQTGKVTNLTGGTTSGGSDLLAQSKQQLVTPSSGGTTTTISSTPTSTPGTQPTNTSSNPDLSTPQKPLPVVSADTP
ncbi:MAG: hypothetical protein J0L73_23065 [Verrucomicrobia bacterium]|nr:hypothetical protein [Verrucomicrobiota bacterium]